MDETIEPGAVSAGTLQSPLSLAALRRLFLSPTEYFKSAPLDQGYAWLLVAWLSGITSVIGRVDQRMLRADLGGTGADSMAGAVDSWPTFWGFVLGFGVLWAAWNWWIGGWWYRVRLRWSGAVDADPRQARLVYMFAGVVFTLPTVLYTIVQSAVHANYRAAWQAEAGWDAIILVFVFWSVVVSWRGVLAVFPVRRTRALWWFAVLPASLYAIVLIGLGVLLAMLQPE